MSAAPVAFITGASRGIGAAAAIALARAGYDVAISARTLEEGERHEHGNRAGAEDDRPLPGSLATTAAAVRECGRRALPVRLDLLEPESLLAAVDTVEKEWGPIDLLVNNGIYQGPGVMDRFLDLRLADAEKTWRGNVLAPIELIQRVLPTMLERGLGTLINLVSASGFTDPQAPTGEGGWGFAYSSSKAAIARLVGILAVEHPAPGLHFFNVEPGFIVTELVKRTGLGDELAGRYAGAPPEVPAAVIAWLATSEEAREWHGKTVSAQRLCADLELLPGWPPNRDASGGS
jgi:NAD(P)-dependent dehydrogenase (short-subunit alcohol dehydrogenase family)